MEVGMRNKRIFILVLSLFFIGFSLFALEKKKKDELYQQVELFSSALGMIESEYVEDVSYKDLIYGALKGMLSSLDPHSQFLDPESYNELKIETEGKFGGIGIEITIKDGLLTVVTPLEDTPANRAGIKPNDRNVKINQELTRNITLNEAVKKLRGKPGTEVNITVFREQENKILEFKLIRDIIRLEDVKEAKILEDKIGYIRITEFRENTSSQLKEALKKLKNEGMSALILDLRNNPGGLLDSAVKVASLFIEKGKLILTTKSKNSRQNLTFFAKESSPILDIPMVVLVNQGSASGAEIVAACLKDYKRAIILGEKTFGKGSVQTIFPLSDGSALRLTTSKYFTPKGSPIHNEGVTPDIVVEEKKEQPTKEPSESPQDIFEKIEKEKKEPLPRKDYKEDIQLQRALDILKALQILSLK